MKPFYSIGTLGNAELLVVAILVFVFVAGGRAVATREEQADTGSHKSSESIRSSLLPLLLVILFVGLLFLLSGQEAMPFLYTLF